MKSTVHSRVVALFASALIILSLVCASNVCLAATPDVSEIQKLLASDAAERSYFGSSVALDGNTALIGASGDDNKGAAHVFTRDASGVWLEQSKLVASDGAPMDHFGINVALEGDTALIGASGGLERNGAVYVFTRDASGTWSEQRKLRASDAVSRDGFGGSVALDGDTALISADMADSDGLANNGAVYVFERDPDGSWLQQVKLLASDAASHDNFGASVALDGNTALIGARGDDSSGFENNGAAYVFTRDASGAWSEQAKLVPSDAGRYANFGGRVALDGNTALIGAIGDDSGGFENNGAAYVFTRDSGGAWSEQAKLQASDAMSYFEFGVNVALDGDFAMVGASRRRGTQGAAYVFMRDADGVWFERARLLASDRTYWDRLGGSIALEGDTAVAGVSGKWEHFSAAGAAYIFDLSNLPWRPAHPAFLAPVRDVSGDGRSDFVVATRIDDGYQVSSLDGVRGGEIVTRGPGQQEALLFATMQDVSGNGLDEIMSLSVTDDGMSSLRVFDCGTMESVSRFAFGRWFYRPLALLALEDRQFGLGAKAAAMLTTADTVDRYGVPTGYNLPLVIVRNVLTGEKINKLRYSGIGTPIGAAVLADIDGNSVEEIAVFGESAEGRAWVKIRDALTGEKLATFGFSKHLRPLLVGSIPPISGDASDELVVVGVHDDGAVRIEVRDSLSHQRLTTRWLRRIDEETPLAMGYVAHPAGPALAVLTEGVDGKYRTRIKRLTSSEPGWQVNFPLHITPHDFAVMDDTSGTRVPELLVVGENRRGIVKALARDAETGEELFRTNIP